MFKKILPYILPAVVVFSISCSEESNPSFDKANFTSIFDNNQFDSAYYPIDIKQTADEGYLVLAEKRLEGEFAGVYILKANKFGTFESDTEVDAQFVNPIGTLMPIGNTFYFFCMDADSKSSRLMGVNQSGELISTANVNITYPCASSPSGQSKFILLGYDHVNKKTKIATVDPGSGSVLQQSEFGVGVGGEDKVEEDIINHFFQFGRKLPFFVGQVSDNLYFFNGFYDYTFSLVFTKMGVEDEFTGLIQGQHEDGGFSAALPLGGNNFAASIFNFGDNYILPSKSLQISAAPDVAVNLGGYTLQELVPNASIKIMKATMDTKSVIVFAGDTKAKQIGLWFYDEAKNSLLSNRYFGFSNPFEVGNLTQTADGGLAVCGTTYIAGRFPRICIFKISKDELNSQMR